MLSEAGYAPEGFELSAATSLEGSSTLVATRRLRAQSQLGQDLWVAAMTGTRPGGFFVDIGAFDGVDISNTWMLETQLGWRGICVEPNPILADAVRVNRRALCVERAVAPGEQRTISFVPAGVLGTIVGYENSDHHGATRAPMATADNLIEVRTISPSALFEQGDAPHHIDYVSLDTEGAEFDILSGFDHNRWRVGLFTVEHNHVPEPRERIRGLLSELGYRCMPLVHDDCFWHPDHLAVLNRSAPIDYERICDQMAQP